MEKWKTQNHNAIILITAYRLLSTLLIPVKQMEHLREIGYVIVFADGLSLRRLYHVSSAGTTLIYTTLKYICKMQFF